MVQAIRVLGAISIAISAKLISLVTLKSISISLILDKTTTDTQTWDVLSASDMNEGRYPCTEYLKQKLIRGNDVGSLVAGL